MKRTFLLFAVVAVAMLYACSKDAATPDEAQPATQEVTTAEIPTPLSFAQTRQIVADVLGDAVAAQITPTARYLKFTFESTAQMFTELAKGEIEYSPAPMFGEAVEEVTMNEDQPKPMYALVDSNVALPEGIAYEVLAESFDPHSPLSGLTDEQAGQVMQAIKLQTPQTRATAYDWKPSGHIEIQDQLSDLYLAVPNVSVIVTGYKAGSGTVLQTETVTTNSEGRYTCTKEFFGPVSERVKWANTYWSVLSNTTDIAYTNSPAMDRKAWNLTLSPYTTDQRNYQYASAFRAADNMHRNGYPVSAALSGTSFVSICCLDAAVPAGYDDTFAPKSNQPTTAILSIYCQNKTGQDIYYTVNRELGKAVQYLRINAKTKDYTQVSKIVKDSWGEFTKFYFAEMEYQRLNIPYKLHSYTEAYPDIFGGVRVPKPDDINVQKWYYNTQLPASAQCRTPMFIDILDDFDQSIWPENESGSNVKYPNDYFVSPMIGIEHVIEWSQTCKSAEDVKLGVRSVVQNYGATAINDLFSVYEELDAAL